MSQLGTFWSPPELQLEVTTRGATVLFEEITEKANRAVKWSALMEMLSRAVAPIATLVLARFLTPEDFGVVGTAMIAVSFAQMFWDAGLSKVLIQIEEIDERIAGVVFWTNAALGMITYAILYIASPWFSHFFNSPKSELVLKVLGLQVILASLSTVQHALLVRSLDFRGLFWIRFATAFISVCVSIPLAVLEHGLWALVGGVLTSQLLNCLLLWSVNPWRPRLQYDVQAAKAIMRLGVWFLAESTAGWVIMWIDTLVVAKFLSVHELGVYRTGLMFVALVFALIMNPLTPLLFPTFSRLQNDAAALRDYFSRVNRLVMAFVLPLGLALFITGPEIETILFGDKWHGLGIVLSVLGLREAITWLVGVNQEIYRAIGKPGISVKLTILALTYWIPAYFVSIQYGLFNFLIIRLILTFITLPIHIYVLSKVTGIRYSYLWDQGRYFFGIFIFLIFFLYFLKYNILYMFQNISTLCVLITLYTGLSVLYLLLIMFFEKSFLSSFFQRLRDSIST
jgi:PST family polysaccharide transporter